MLRGMLAEIGNITTVQQTTANSRFPSRVPSLGAMTGNCIFQGIRYLPSDIHCKHSSQIPPPLICAFIVHVFFAKRNASSRTHAYRMESDTRLLCNQPATYILQAFSSLQFHEFFANVKLRTLQTTRRFLNRQFHTSKL